MTKPQNSLSHSLIISMALTISVLTACSNTDDPSQVADMAPQGEPDAKAEATVPDADQYLSSLKLVAEDGSEIKDPVFEVDYKKLPMFKEISHIPYRKKAFFDYLTPAIEYQNQLISEQRMILKGIEIKVNTSEALSQAQTNYMGVMRERYRIPEGHTQPEAVALLLRRIDTLPSSMVLAQAAMESAWGTSRFAREANNLFGQWCFSKGCGVVPSQRSKGQKHEVAKFSTVDKAIGAYYLNINSHPAYLTTRDIRAKLRDQNKALSGHDMVAGLEKYSARGTDYIDELRSMIRTNKLE